MSSGRSGAKAKLITPNTLFVLHHLMDFKLEMLFYVQCCNSRKLQVFLISVVLIQFYCIFSVLLQSFRHCWCSAPSVRITLQKEMPMPVVKLFVYVLRPGGGQLPPLMLPYRILEEATQSDSTEGNLAPTMLVKGESKSSDHGIWAF